MSRFLTTIAVLLALALPAQAMVQTPCEGRGGCPITLLPAYRETSDGSLNFFSPDLDSCRDNSIDGFDPFGLASEDDVTYGTLSRQMLSEAALQSEVVRNRIEAGRSLGRDVVVGGKIAGEMSPFSAPYEAIMGKSATVPEEEVSRALAIASIVPIGKWIQALKPFWRFRWLAKTPTEFKALEEGLSLMRNGAGLEERSLAAAKSGAAKWMPGLTWQGPAASRGSWVGDIGNSGFKLADTTADAMGVPRGAVVNFVEGAPDFSSFSKMVTDVPGLTGVHAVDQPLIVKHLADTFGMSQADIRQWLSIENLRMHHFHASQVQLPDAAVHSLHHTGSASALRGGN